MIFLFFLFLYVLPHIEADIEIMKICNCKLRWRKINLLKVKEHVHGISEGCKGKANPIVSNSLAYRASISEHQQRLHTVVSGCKRGAAQSHELVVDQS